MITAHELARQLLAGPDVPVAHTDEFGDQLIEGFHIDPEAHQHFEEDWEPDHEADITCYQHRLAIYKKPHIAIQHSIGHRKLKKNAPQRTVVVIG
jgi:hypothetical protein